MITKEIQELQTQLQGLYALRKMKSYEENAYFRAQVDDEIIEVEEMIEHRFFQQNSTQSNQLLQESSLAK